MMPEERLPLLRPIYREFGDTRTADVLDALAFAFPRPAEIGEICRHVYGSDLRSDPERRKHAAAVRGHLAKLRIALRERGMDLVVGGRRGYRLHDVQ